MLDFKLKQELRELLEMYPSKEEFCHMAVEEGYAKSTKIAMRLYKKVR